MFEQKAVYMGKPAYGRKYESQADAMKDWENGKDFKLIEGPYFSKRDFASILIDAKFELTIKGYEYPIGIIFFNSTKNNLDVFYINSKGICVLS